METILRTLDERIDDIEFNVVNVADFNERVVGAYNNGTAEKGLDAAPERPQECVDVHAGSLPAKPEIQSNC